MLAKGLLLGNLKKLHNDFVKCADRYFREFATLVTTDKSKMDMFGDLDGFDKSFREWAKVSADWEPKKEVEYLIIISRIIKFTGFPKHN